MGTADVLIVAVAWAATQAVSVARGVKVSTSAGSVEPAEESEMWTLLADLTLWPGWWCQYDLACSATVVVYPGASVSAFLCAATLASARRYPADCNYM